MANLVKKIRTEQGDLQIDYNALANLPTLNTMFSNPNLLINSDFRKPVNQRGASSYKSDAGNWSRIYTVDRWNMQNGASCTVNTSSITLKGNASQSGTSCFCQIIDGALPADTYTVQVKVKSLSNGGAVSITNSASQQVFSSNLKSGLNTFTVSNTTVFFVSIDLGSNSTVELEWIKLEQGSIGTPFVPRLYDEEFLICQRYYQTTKIHRTIRSDVYNEEIIETIPYGIALRKVPILTSTVVQSFNVHDLSTSDNEDTCIYRVAYKLSSEHGIGHMFELTLVADAEIY